MLAQMGGSAAALRAHEEVFAYWASRRVGDRPPGRANIDPCDFKRHLPTISLIDVVGTTTTRRYRVRLAGTGLYGVYGREITGKALDEVYEAGPADYWRAELDAVVDRRRPGVGSHSLAWRGQSHLSILWLRLPLADETGLVNMILGYDMVVGANRPSLSSGIRAA